MVIHKATTRCQYCITLETPDLRALEQTRLQAAASRLRLIWLENEVKQQGFLVLSVWHRTALLLLLQSVSLHHERPGSGCLPPALQERGPGCGAVLARSLSALGQGLERPGDHRAGGETEEHRRPSGPELASNPVLAVRERIRGEGSLAAGTQKVLFEQQQQEKVLLGSPGLS